MPPIEKQEVLTYSQKFWIKAGNFLTINLAAYGIGAGAGLYVGDATQKFILDKAPYYTDAAHKQAKEEYGKINSFEDFQKQKKAKEEQETKAWWSRLYDKIQKNGIDPVEYIKDSESYKEIRFRYFESVKGVADSVALFNAVLTLIMLGGFIRKRLSAIRGNVVQKEQTKRIVNKQNEVIDGQNENSGKIAQLENRLDGLTSALIILLPALQNGTATPEQIENAKAIVLSMEDKVPTSEELDSVAPELQSDSKKLDFELPS